MCDGDNMKRNDETCKCECDNQHQCTTPFVLLKNSPTSCGCGCSEESVKYVAGLGETFSLSSSCKAECNPASKCPVFVFKTRDFNKNCGE